MSGKTTKTHRDRWVKKQLLKGKCIKCSDKALEGKVRCAKHHEEYMEYQRNYNLTKRRDKLNKALKEIK